MILKKVEKRRSGFSTFFFLVHCPTGTMMPSLSFGRIRADSPYPVDKSWPAKSNLEIFG
jgi:hypothetical protein